MHFRTPPMRSSTLQGALACDYSGQLSIVEAAVCCFIGWISACLGSGPGLLRVASNVWKRHGLPVERVQVAPYAACRRELLLD